MSRLLLLGFGGHTTGGSAGNEPPPVTDSLEVHLKRNTGFYSDAGVTPQTTDGGAIYRWADQSGNNRHAEMSTAANRPTLDISGGPNGLMAVRFDPSVAARWFEGFSGLASIALTNGVEGFFLLKAAADPAVSTPKGSWDFGGTQEQAPFYPGMDGVIYDAFGTAHTKVPGNPTTNMAAWHLYNPSSSNWPTQPEGWRAFHNGTQINDFSAANTVGMSATPRLGVNRNGTGFDGWVAEFLLYGKMLSSTERDDVTAYLMTAAGL